MKRRLLLGLALIALVDARAEDALAPLANAANAWVHTRTETVRARNEWSEQRELLAATVQQLQDRAQSLEDERDGLRAKGEADRKAEADLRQANEHARRDLAAIESALRGADETLVRLRPQLPPRLSAALELPYRTLQQPQIALGERMQVTIAILARCEQFNHSVTGGQEVVSAAGLSEPKLVDTLYWGLANGYAYDRMTGAAWIGISSASGWRWQPCPAAAPALRTLLAAREDKAEPELVNLPAQLRAGGGDR